MNTRELIERGRQMAEGFAAKGRDEFRLAVFNFQDWCEIYRKPPQGPSLKEHRRQTRQNWYLVKFLEKMGVTVTPVPVRADEFLDWAEGAGCKLDDGHDLAHAVGDYVNRPEAQSSACRHSEKIAELLAEHGPCLATISVFGESPEEPEVMSVVVHRNDGSVLSTAEYLAHENTPQQAWDQAMQYLNKYGPQGVFHDQTIRRTEFCPDCNQLIVHVASRQDIEANIK